MLWCFGCSFSVALDAHYTALYNNYPVIENNYQTALADKLKQNLTVQAQYGVGNDWIWQRFSRNFENYANGDYIIVQTTSLSRYWLTEKYPECSNFMMCPVEKDWFTKDELKAIELHKRHLWHDTVLDSNYDMFVCALLYIANMRPDLKILFLPGFHDIAGVGGRLNDICMGEFTSQDVADKYYATGETDFRINHMSEKNHLILADKIYEFFENDQALDLKTGFETGLITDKNYLTYHKS